MPATSLCGLRSYVERLSDLSFIDTIEHMAVVDQNFGANSASGTQTHEHHVETENLHVLYASATIALNLDFQLQTVLARN